MGFIGDEGDARTMCGCLEESAQEASESTGGRLTTDVSVRMLDSRVNLENEKIYNPC